MIFQEKTVSIRSGSIYALECTMSVHVKIDKFEKIEKIEHNVYACLS